METALIIIIGLLLLLTAICGYKAERHYRRFRAIKPNDKVEVTIYSPFCECQRKAVVIEHHQKYIKAKLTEEEFRSCAEYAIAKGLNNDSGCWFRVRWFDKYSVKPL